MRRACAECAGAEGMLGTTRDWRRAQTGLAPKPFFQTHIHSPLEPGCPTPEQDTDCSQRYEDRHKPLTSKWVQGQQPHRLQHRVQASEAPASEAPSEGGQRASSKVPPSSHTCLPSGPVLGRCPSSTLAVVRLDNY